MLAYDYPLMGLFWTMLWWFLWIAWIVIVIQVITDIFRSDDMGGLAKALWAIFVIVVPWLGVLVYLIARGDSMRERHIRRAQEQNEMFRSYVQDVASTGPSTADELSKLAGLHSQGVLSDAEFAAQKARLLG